MKIKGLKKAVGDYKAFNQGGYYSPHYGNLMYNTETGDLWTDEFWDLGHSFYIPYQSENIVDLGKMMTEKEITVTTTSVKEFIKNNFENKE